MTEIILAQTAARDLLSIPEKVSETFLSKRRSAKKNMDIGAEPEQAIVKYLKGSMNPVIQMNLDRDYRTWFIEGNYIQEFDDEHIYCVKILAKKEAKKLTGQVRNSLEYVEGIL